MLLRFGFENFLSFRDYAELHFTATKLSDNQADLIAPQNFNHRLLPTLALYGANASGKSNVLKAFRSICSAVRHSFTRIPGEPLPYSPFLLSSETRNQPSRFDITILVDGVRYEFGFCHDQSTITEEWLYAWPEGRRQIWYHRDSQAEADPWYFGPSLKGDKRRLKELTRDESLFLSVAAHHNHQQLGPIFEWFAQTQRYQPIEAESILRFHQDSVILEPAMKGIVQSLLQHADLGLVDFRAIDDEQALRPLYLQTQGPEDISVQLKWGQPMAQRVLKKLELAHLSEDGSVTYLPSDLESHGTTALLHLSVPMLEAIMTGSRIYGDELDRGLHSKLSAAIIDVFQHRDSNKKGAQLLFTTQDDGLLDHLRRDSVVLVEKDPNSGASRLIPLSDFKTRQRDNIKKAYNQGRFGGVPFIQSFSSIFDELGELDG